MDPTGEQAVSYWPAWLGGLSLATVMVLHWFGVGRMMAVSGRVTAIIDRLRLGPREPAAHLSEDELVAALRAATEAEFGTASLPEPAPSSESSARGESRRPARRAPQPFAAHLVMFVFLGLGGLLATRSSWSTSATLRGQGFATLAGGSPWVSAGLLLVGGILVGFGTRMAGGCTSGHGLCGASRLQRGSLLATVGFFGAGVVTSFVLGRFL